MSQQENFFGNPTTGTGDFQGGLKEHLYLNNGPLGTMIGVKGGLAEFVGDAKKPMTDRVEKLFLATLNRRPDDAEMKKFAEYLTGGGSAADAVWCTRSSNRPDAALSAFATPAWRCRLLTHAPRRATWKRKLRGAGSQPSRWSPG